MKMTMRQAKSKLKKLAKGRYHAIRVSYITHSGEKAKKLCYLYLDTGEGEGDAILEEHPTFEESFKELTNRMGAQPCG
jgi:hypothetical protein